MRRAFSLIAVCCIALTAAACSFATAADAAPVFAAMAASADPGWAEGAAMAMTLSAAGVTASSSLQADDAAAGAVAVAPRVTLESIEAKIVREETHVFDDLLTVHVLTMANGFKITGESACASPENYNAELGVKIARDQAIRKAWGFEGYLLREQLHASG
jgi:hypothetical protein